MQPGPYLIIGAALGLIAGGAFYHLWRGLLPRARSREFWASVPGSIHGMLTSVEGSELLRHYRVLVTAATRYSLRSTLAVVAGIAPVVGAALLLSALDPSSRVAASIEIHPATVSARALEHVSATDVARERLLIRRSALENAPVRLAGQSLDSSALSQKQALCATGTACLLFEMLLFETRSIDSRPRGAIDRSIVVRPVLFDRNPFWPYLNDLDLSFLIAVMSGGAAAAWYAGRRRADAC